MMRKRELDSSVAARRELVTTVISDRSASKLANSITVLPPSKKIESPELINLTASAAIKRFSLEARPVLVSNPDSSSRLSILIAPPWTRRTRPSSSMASKSRRTVATDTLRSLRKSSTRTIPARRMRPLIRSRLCDARSVLSSVTIVIVFDR